MSTFKGEFLPWSYKNNAICSQNEDVFSPKHQSETGYLQLLRLTTLLTVWLFIRIKNRMEYALNMLWHRSVGPRFLNGPYGTPFHCEIYMEAAEWSTARWRRWAVVVRKQFLWLTLEPVEPGPLSTQSWTLDKLRMNLNLVFLTYLFLKAFQTILVGAALTLNFLCGECFGQRTWSCEYTSWRRERRRSHVV